MREASNPRFASGVERACPGPCPDRRLCRVNFLAHLYLAKSGDDDLVGNLLGDFIKGPVEDAPARYQAGIRLHRGIDSFTDDHLTVAASRGRIQGTRRRYAGIIVDMCYDHFLARDWEVRSEEPLDVFSARVYGLLTERRDHLPPRLARALPWMQREDWLGSYRDPAGIALALDRIGLRLKRGNALIGSGAELLSHYEGLGADFDSFFPDLEAFVSTQ